MSDIIVGSVGVRLVPSAEGFSAKAKALTKGLVTDVRMEADTKSAAAELDAAAHERTATVEAQADTAKASAQLDEAARTRTASIRADSGGASGAIGKLVAAVGLLGPALVPLAGAGAGFAAYGAVALKSVKDVEAAEKQINKLRAQGTKQSLKEADALEKSLTGPQKKFLAAQGALTGSFGKLMDRVGPAVFKPLTAGLDLLTKVLPKLGPVINAVSKSLVGIIGHLGKSLSGKGFSAFLAYVVKSIPPVISFLGSLTKAVGAIFKSLAPAGAVVLAVLTKLFDWIAKIPTNVLGPVLVGLAGLAAGPWVGLIIGLVTVFENLWSTSAKFRTGLTAVAATVRSNLAPVFKQLTQTWNSELLPTIKQIAPILLQMAAKAVVFGSAVLGKLLPPLIRLAGWLAAHVLPLFVKFENFKLTLVINALELVGRAGKGLWNVLRASFTAIVGSFLQLAGAIIGGAAKAFGWVPGLGGKLRNAAANFNTFRDHVNSALSGIHDRNVTVTAHVYGISAVNGLIQSISRVQNKDVQVTAHGHKTSLFGLLGGTGADGATVPKTGKPYADRHLYMLADGEEVVSNRHGQADRFRAMRAAGLIPGLADGGTSGKRNPFTASEFRSAASTFNLTEDLGIKALRKEFHKFAETIRKDGGHLGRSFDDLRAKAVKNSRAYDGVTAKFDLVSSRLSAARQTQSQARSTAAGSFAGDLFSGSLADFRTQAEADRNDATKMRAAIRAAKGKGLSGALGAQLAGSGNLALAQQFAHESRSQIASLESLFGQRSAADKNLGSIAASFSDPLIKELRSQRDADRAEMKQLRHVLEHLEQRVEAGARKGIADRNQGAGNRKRTR